MPFDQASGLLRHLRLTIAKKLALAIIGIVILCVGTMAWVTSQNLQRGFIAYLNQLQAEHLDQVARVIEKRYEENGNFNWLRHNRREMRQLLDSVPAKLVSTQFDRPGPPDDRRPDQRGERGMQRQESGQQTARATYGPAPTPVDDKRQQAAVDQRQGGMDGRRPALGQDQRPLGPDGRRPRLGDDQRPFGPDGRRQRLGDDQRPLGPDGRRPPLGEDQRPLEPDGQRPPLGQDQRPLGPDGRRPPLGEDQRPLGPDGRRPPMGEDQRPLGPDGQRPALGEDQRPAADQLPPGAASAPPSPAPTPPATAPVPLPREEDLPEEGQGPRPPHDPMGFGGRLAIIDANGIPVIGPRETPGAIERPLLIRGERIGVLRLAPIEAVSGSSEGNDALHFIQSQIRTILWLALFLLVLAMLLAAMLARHFLRPVSALREVTQQLAAGQFEARAPVMNQDELSELAHHVNDMAQALQENEARRRKLLADISHELRTPLSVIRGEIEALQDGVRKSGPQALNSLHGEVLRLNKLIDDLHQLSLADSGDLRCQHQVFDLAPLLVDIVKRYLPRGAQANLGLKLQLPPGAIMLDGDPDRLTQVVTNLLENSLRYTDAGGAIVLSVRTSTHKVQLLVEDSAPGVAPEALPRLFERLYRTDAARTRTSGGSGLGLSICQALVNAHGGQISAHPSPLGGVRMQIQLPLHAR